MMFNQLANLNWISILIAFVVYFVLGGLWFTLLFGKTYKISLGRKADEVLPNKPIFIIGPALCSLVIIIASAILIYALNIVSVNGAFEFAALVGLGFLVANTINIAINPNMPKPIHYGIISSAYHLVGITLVSIIIVVMR